MCVLVLVTSRSKGKEMIGKMGHLCTASANTIRYLFLAECFETKLAVDVINLLMKYFLFFQNYLFVLKTILLQAKA